MHYSIPFDQALVLGILEELKINKKNITIPENSFMRTIIKNMPTTLQEFANNRYTFYRINLGGANPLLNFVFKSLSNLNWPQVIMICLDQDFLNTYGTNGYVGLVKIVTTPNLYRTKKSL